MFIKAQTRERSYRIRYDSADYKNIRNKENHNYKRRVIWLLIEYIRIFGYSNLCSAYLLNIVASIFVGWGNK